MAEKTCPAGKAEDAHSSVCACPKCVAESLEEKPEPVGEGGLEMLASSLRNLKGCFSDGAFERLILESSASTILSLQAENSKLKARLEGSEWQGCDWMERAEKAETEIKELKAQVKGLLDWMKENGVFIPDYLSNLPEAGRKERERMEDKVTAALDMGIAVGASHKKLEAEITRLRGLIQQYTDGLITSGELHKYGLEDRTALNPKEKS